MKLKLIVVILFLGSSAFTYLIPSIYEYKMISIEGQNISMNSFSGKKMVLITLPGKQRYSDSDYLKKIDTLKNLYGSQTIVIGFPMLEDAGLQSNDSLKIWLRKFISNDVYISESIYTESSSYHQDSLFNWLTHQKKNGHFELEVRGIGQVFLIDGNGQLKSVLTPTFGLPIENIRTAFTVIAHTPMN